MMWGAALFTVASLFTLVAFHVFEAQSAFTLERLSNERMNEQLRYQRLRLMVSSESSAAAVIAASNKFGMGPGPGVITLTVPPAAHASGGSSTAAPSASVPASSVNDYSTAKPALEP
jgi:hypothetical protein